MRLSQYLNDSHSHAIPLAWGGAAFSPGDDWALIFTAKLKSTDEDSAAVFQKTSGAGITVTGYTATVEVVPDDTADLSKSVTLCWDIQAQHVTDGRIRTVAAGMLDVRRDITRATTTSVPVHTTNPPLPYGPPMPAGLDDITSIAITAGDELEIVKDGVTYWTPLYRR